MLCRIMATIIIHRAQFMLDARGAKVLRVV